jgi:cyclohexanone monooxygenase
MVVPLEDVSLAGQSPERATGTDEARERTLDVVIIGAGFGGLYAVHRLRQLGLSLRAYDAAGGVGGTWWWNRYPGARVDFPGGPFYCYTFSEELVREWDWKETQPDQGSVLAYLEYVADKFDLRRDIQLNTRIESARFDEQSQRWLLETDAGEHINAQFLVCATGTLSAQATNLPDIPGLDDFLGEIYHTGHWPQEEVHFAGKRVGVIGTGSSGVQAIPIIAESAGHLTVFQRTPQYTVPARNRPIPPEIGRQSKETWPQLRQNMLTSPQGAPYPPKEPRSALEDDDEQRREVYEQGWEEGALAFLSTYADTLINPEANRYISDFVREKISQTVHDPQVAAKLMPDYYFATKRQIFDGGYLETFNRDNVTLVDLREDPIESVTADAVVTRKGVHPLDMLVLATGYDAMTGALRRLNPVGRHGQRLADEWADGVRTHLGLGISGFPNLFMIHGPESPSVLFNMPLGAELQTDWIADCIAHLRTQRLATIEPKPDAERGWSAQVKAIADQTLFPHTDSWYTGANIPGKPRQFAIHLAGSEYYRSLAAEATDGYPNFVTHGPVSAPQSVDEEQLSRAAVG